MKRYSPTPVLAALGLASCTPQPVPYEGGGFVYVAPAVPVLFYLCCALTAFMLAQAFIRPVRRCYAPLAARLLALVGIRREGLSTSALFESFVARYLFVSGLTFVPLCMALHMDTFSPFFGGPANAGFSLWVAGLAAGLLLWNLFCLGLWAGLTRRRVLPQADAKRRSPQATPTPATPASPRRRSLTRRLLLLLLGALLALALFKGGRYVYLYHILQPRPLPCAEAQRELEDIALCPAREYGKEAHEELSDLLDVFSRTHDVTLRSERKELALLHLACRYAKPALVKHLLQNGADPNELSRDEPLREGFTGTTPLVEATDALLFSRTAEERAALRRIVPMLLEAGADVEGGDGFAYPLNTCAEAAESVVNHQRIPEAEELFILLLQQGASMTSTQNDPYTYKTASNGWVKATKELLARQAPLERHGSHAIHGAALHPTKPHVLECARLLLEAGADPNARDEYPPYNALQLLIESDAFPQAGDAEGLARYGEMAQLLLAHGAKLDEPWLIRSEKVDWRLSHHLHRRDEELAQSLREGGEKSIGEVLRERRPELAAWLEQHGTTLPTP